MFKKENHENYSDDVETIIGPSVKVEGDFVGHGNLVIEGVVKGNVKTDGNLTVGEKSQITASISANNATISGEIKGNIAVKNDLELTATANVSGDISAKSISIARGATLNGNCRMDENAGATNGKKTGLNNSTNGKTPEDSEL